ncbi:MAG TPA: CPBP family intramembrane glutamic endopeptidase, partial [Thermoanaerobaculia bacterium]
MKAARVVAIPVLWSLVMLTARFADPVPVIAVSAVTMAAVVGWHDRMTLRPLLRVTPRIAMLAFVAATAMVAVTYLAFPLLVTSIPRMGTETQLIYTRFLSHRRPMVLIAAVIPVIVAEEVLWRGVFQGSLARVSVLTASVVYCVAHAPAGSLLLMSVALVCGLYWSALRKISGSLIPPLCAHLVWDIVLIA